MGIPALKNTTSEYAKWHNGLPPLAYLDTLGFLVYYNYMMLVVSSLLWETPKLQNIKLKLMQHSSRLNTVSYTKMTREKTGVAETWLFNLEFSRRPTLNSCAANSVLY